MMRKKKCFRIILIYGFLKKNNMINKQQKIINVFEESSSSYSMISMWSLSIVSWFFFCDVATNGWLTNRMPLRQWNAMEWQQKHNTEFHSEIRRFLCIYLLLTERTKFVFDTIFFVVRRCAYSWWFLLFFSRCRMECAVCRWPFGAFFEGREGGRAMAEFFGAGTRGRLTHTKASRYDRYA